MFGTGDGRIGKVNQLNEVIMEVDACDTKSPILTLVSVTNGIISGSKDGQIKLWDSMLSCLIDLGCINSEVRSIGFFATTNTVLIGTSSNNIYEVSISYRCDNFCDAVIVKSTSSKNIAGSAISPCKSILASTSNDKIFNLWDLKEKKWLRSLGLDTPPTCCTFSPDGSMVAIGFGSPTKIFASETPGRWIVLDVTNLSKIFEHRPSRKMITIVKWSNEYIAVGSQDCKVYMYVVDPSSSEKFQSSLICTIDQHYSPISNIEFSMDLNFLKVNCQYNLYFFRVADGSHVQEVSSLRDVKWMTHNCCFSWDVQGVWSCYTEVTETDMLCTDSILGNDCDLTVAGFSCGTLGLFHYPCINDDNPYHIFKAHYKRVGNVLWINNSQFISTGIDDNAIIVWTRSNVESDDNDWDQLPPTDEVQTKDNELRQKPPVQSEVEFTSQSICKNDYSNMTDWVMEKESRPWKATVIEPDCIETNESKLEESTRMVQISGLDGQLLHCMNRNEIVSATGSVCIITNVINNEQSYFRGHTNMVSCIALSSSHLIASGDRGRQVSIRIWDFNTCKEITSLDSFHCYGIRHLAFSDDNHFLFSIGEERKNCVGVWKSLSSEWHDAVIHMQAQTGLSVPYFLTSCNDCFVTGEDNGVTFWAFKKNIIPIKGKIAHENDKQPMLCCTSCDDGIITGSLSGCLCVWVDKALSSKVEGHETAITCLQRFESGFVSGSKDGIIYVWSTSLQKEMKFDMKQHLGLNSEIVFSMHSISCDRKDKCNKLYVGVQYNGIYEISTKTSNIKCFKESHKRRVFDVAFHPLYKTEYCSCDDEGIIRFWDHVDCNVKKRISLNTSLSCLDWSSDGTELLVGGTMPQEFESVEPYTVSTAITGKN